MGALYKGFIVTAVTSLIIMYPVTDSISWDKNTYNNNAGAIFTGLDLYICGVVGFCNNRIINLGYRILYWNRL